MAENETSPEQLKAAYAQARRELDAELRSSLLLFMESCQDKPETAKREVTPGRP